MITATNTAGSDRGGILGGIAMVYRNGAHETSPHALFCGAGGQRVSENLGSSGSRRFAGWTAGVLLSIALTQLSAALILIVAIVIGTRAFIFPLGWFAAGYSSVVIAGSIAQKIAPEIEDHVFGGVMLAVLFGLAVLDALGGGNNTNAWISSLAMIFFGGCGVTKAARV
jgi:hypothetical protein